MKTSLVLLLFTFDITSAAKPKTCSVHGINTLNSLSKQFDRFEKNYRKDCRKDAQLTNLIDSLQSQGKTIKKTIEKIFNIFNGKNWKKHNGHCYLLVPQAVEWEQAQKRCADMNGYLLTIENAKEQEWIHKQIVSFTNTSYWIGLNVNESKFHWVYTKKKPNFKQFAKKYPRPSRSHCGYQYNNLWYNSHCWAHRYFICERNSC